MNFAIMKRFFGPVLCVLLLSAGTVLADTAFDELMGAGKYAEASRHAEDNIPVANRDASIWARLAFAYEKQGLKEKALACYMVSLRTGENYEALLGAARINNALKQPETAIDFAKKALALRASGEASWEYASACIALGKPGEAKAALENVVESDPKNVVASRELGTIAFKAKEYRKALPLLKVARESGSGIAAMIAKAHRELKELDSAVAYLKLIVNDSKYHAAAVLDLARISWELEDYKSCARNFAKVERKELTAEDLYHYAVSLEKSGSSADASAAEYAAAAEKYGAAKAPEAIDAREKAGRHSLSEKQYADALAHFTQIAKADPKGGAVKDIDFLLADAYMGLNQKLKAATQLEGVIARDAKNIEAHARLAEIYEAQNQGAKAKATLEKLVTLQPNNPAVQLTLGQYNLKAKKYGEALGYFQKSFTLEASAAAAEGMTVAAWELKKTDLARDAAESALHHDATLDRPRQILVEIYLKDKNFSGAKSLLEKMVKEQPREKKLWLDLATCYENLDDAKSLAEADRAIMGIDPKDVASRTRYAEAMLEKGSLQEAAATYKELLALRPANADAAKKIADIAIKRKNADEAIEYLKKYVEMKPSDAAARRDLGGLLLDKKDSAGAIAAYRAAFAADPSLVGYFENFAGLLLSGKTTDSELASVLPAAIAAGEAGEPVFVALGDLFRKQGKMEEAIEQYQGALKRNPQNFEVLSALADCQAEAGKPADAILSYEQALALKPADAAGQKALGDLYLGQGKKAQAVSCYKKYLVAKPDDSKTALLVGEFEYDAKKFKEALSYLGKVSGDAAATAEYLEKVATASYETGDLKKAEDAFLKLVAIAPKNAAAFRTLYEIGKKNNDKPAMIDALKKYTALEPTDLKPQLALAELLRGQKDSTGALAAYRAALKADPTARGFYAEFVALTEAKGTDAEKMAALQGAVTSGEADAAMYARLGELHRKAGNPSKAVDMYEQASRLEPKNGKLLVSLAECQVEAGSPEKAVASYEQAVLLDPGAVKAYKALGDLYVKLEKNDAAVKAYRKYLGKSKDEKIAKFVGEQAVERKDFAEAVKYLGMVGGEAAKTQSFLSMYGEACFEAKEDEKALEIYKQLGVMAPKNPSVFWKLYEIAARGKKLDEAITYLKKYTALKPLDASAQRKLADRLCEQKDTAGAVAAYRALLKADPKAKGFYKKYAGLVIATGSDAEIMAALTGAVDAGEADAAMYARLGGLHRKQEAHDKAAAMYEKASQKDPKNVQYLADLAESQAKSGNANAAATYEQAIAMNPKAVAEHKALGDLYWKQKKSEAAVRSYKRYLENKQNNDLAIRVGGEAMKEKNYKEAVKYFAMVKGDDAAATPFLQEYGKASYLAGDNAGALPIFEKLAEKLPQNAGVFETLNDLQAKAGKKNEALASLKKYVALKPADAKAQRSLADQLYERGDGKGALAAYQALRKADTSAKGFYKRYVTLAIKSGSEAEKKAALSGAIDAGEADVSMYRELAEIRRAAGAFAEAVPLFKKAVQLDPRDPGQLSALADCQVKAGEVKDAILTYEQAVAMNPGARNEYKALGDLYWQEKKYGPAVAAYKKYLEKGPADNTLAIRVGQAEFAAKKFTSAKKYLAMVTGDKAETASFLKLYGKAAFSAKDYPTAGEAYTKLETAILPKKDPEVFAMLVDIAAAEGKADAVVDNLKKYIALKPADAAAQRKLADLLYDRKDSTGSFSAYRAALAADPKMTGMYKRYVPMALAVGSTAQKISALTGAVAAGEADGGMHASLGDLYRDTKSYAKAIDAYTEALKADPKNTTLLFSLADCQAKAGKTADAALSYEQALAMDPEKTEAYKTLGDLYRKQKKDDAAVAVYRKYLKRKPGDDAVAKIVGSAAFAEKKYDEAYGYLSTVSGDNSQKFLTEYGLSAAYTKHDSVAIAVLDKLRQSRNLRASAEVLKALAEAYERTGDIKSTASVLRSYVRKPGVKDPDAAYKRASLTETFNPATAALIYEANIKSYPGDYRNYLGAGNYYAKRRATASKGLALLEKSSSLADTVPEVWLELGRLYGEMNKNGAMLEAYRRFAALDQQNVDAIVKIGETLMAKEMVDDAMVFLEMANTMRDNDPAIMALLARGYLETGRRDQAARIIERVIKITKGKVSDSLRMTLVDIYLETGKYDPAIGQLNVLLAEKRTNDRLLRFAQALYATNMFPEAVNAIEDIKATEPDNISAIMILGKIQTRQKKYNDAIETYKEALYIDQSYAPAMVERANVYLLQKKYQWAKTFYERALKIDTTLAGAHLGLARAAKVAGDTATYKAELERAYALDPEDEEILREKGIWKEPAKDERESSSEKKATKKKKKKGLFGW